MKNYEIYLTDDQGRRIQLLNNISFMSLSRATRGFGTIHLGIPLEDFKVFPYFLPDRRVEVWRAPYHGATLRDEGSYLLRKFQVYTREEDNVQIIEFWGRSPIDILRRGAVTSTTLADYQKTDQIDDMMKDIVQDSLITPAISVPTGEMTVDGSDALGPSITHSFFGQNILDILNDLRDISFTKHEEDADNNRIYFDVVRGAPLATGGFGYIFRTYADIRGTDRTGGVVFSPENGNVKGPAYFEDHLDSFTQAQILNLSTPAANGSATSPDATLSRWNTSISTQQTSETDADVNDSKAFAVLQEGKADQEFNASFVDSPGSSTQPRSLYGADWDLGDLLPVRYAAKDLTVEVKTVYLSIDESGEENIVGMGELREETPASVLDLDQYYSALIHFDDVADGSTTITDEYGNVWTAVGNAQVDTAVFKFGVGSLLLDGTGDYIQGSGAAKFAFGTGDFQIDFQVRIGAAGVGYTLFDFRPVGTNGLYPTLSKDASNVLVYFTNSANRITGTTALATGSFYHICLSRRSGNTRLFLNGVQEGSTYVDANNYLCGASRPLFGGQGFTPAGNTNGWMDEIRILKGVAAQVATFTPPSSAYPNGQ